MIAMHCNMNRFRNKNGRISVWESNETEDFSFYSKWVLIVRVENVWNLLSNIMLSLIMKKANR